MSTLAALWLLAAPIATPPATLILFRDQAEPLIFKPTISVDGVELGKLGQNRFLTIELSGGRHRVEARWPAVAGHKPAMLHLTVHPGSESYVGLTGTAAFWRTAATTRLVPRTPAEGSGLVAGCCKPSR